MKYTIEELRSLELIYARTDTVLTFTSWLERHQAKDAPSPKESTYEKQRRVPKGNRISNYL